MKEYDRSRRVKDPVGELVRGAQKRAKMQGKEFDIVKEDLLPFPEYCPVLGLQLLYGSTGRKKAASASLDRFDNTKGYIKGNVRIISMRANELKHDATLEEMRAIVKYMETLNE